MKGIDVSYCQEGMDFQAAADGGMEFAIVRIGRRGDGGDLYLDTSFIDNINGALNTGMAVGVYFYTKATTADQAAEDAQWIDEQLKTYCAGADLKMGVWYDVEDADTTGAQGGEMVTAICSRFICEMNELGYKNAGIYSSYSWLTNGTIDIDQLAEYVPYWVAQYNSQDDLSLERPDKNVRIWQYTDHVSDDLPYDGDIYYE